MAKLKLQLFFMLLLGTTLASPSQAKDVIYTALYEGLEWREIGPWRGGRVTAVTGVLSDDRTYYMGATGGGVWKTNNAGNSWRNVSDGYFGVGTIGAIAVAESDENIVYVGTGEAPIRGVTTSHGDGMYKSTDAGKTWRHIGLKDAGQIARVMKAFDFEATRVDFAVFAHAHCVDSHNYYKTHGAFEFELSIDELNEAIGQ